MENNASSFGWKTGGGGGALAAGILQLQNGVAINTTLRKVADQANTVSPLQLSTTQVGIGVVTPIIGSLMEIHGEYILYSINTALNGTAYMGIGSSNNNTNMTAGHIVGALEFNGRRSGTQSSLARTRVVYMGDGTTRNADYIIAVANSGTVSDSFVLGGSIFAQIPSNSRAFLVGGNQFTGATYSGAAQMSVSYNLVVAGDANHSISAGARLHVRGNGVNSIARFDNGSAIQVASIDNNGFITGARFQTYGGASRLEAGAIVHTGGTASYFTFGQQSSNAGFIFSNSSNWSVTSGTAYDIDFQNITFGAAAGSANYRKLNLAYTINNSGAQTGTATGIYSRATETALNGMLHNLIDLGTTALGSLFSVNNVGAIKVATIADGSAPNSSLYFSSTASKLVWKDAAGVVNNLY